MKRKQRWLASWRVCANPVRRGAVGAHLFSALVVVVLPAQRIPHPPPKPLRSTDAGRWGGPITAVEERRISGTPGAGQFGVIADVASLPDGGAILIDSKGTDGPAIYQFDGKGAFVRRLGRTGAGPGEHGQFVGYGDLAVDAAGTVYLHDPANHRIDRWNADGSPMPSWPLPPNNQAPLFPKLLPGRSGDLYVAARVAEDPSGGAFNPRNDGYVHINARGAIVDTVRSPNGLQSIVNSLWSPQDYWMPTPAGERIRSRSSILGFAMLGPTGDTVMSVSRSIEAVHFGSVERMEQQAILTWSAPFATGISTPQSLPPVKPPYSNVWVDPNQRLWFELHVPAVSVPPFPALAGQYRTPPPMISYVEPPVFAGFTITGQYLGEVHFPTGTRQVSFRDDIAWGVAETSDGAVVLVKWRLPGARR